MLAGVATWFLSSVLCPGSELKLSGRNLVVPAHPRSGDAKLLTKNPSLETSRGGVDIFKTQTCKATSTPTPSNEGEAVFQHHHAWGALLVWFLCVCVGV
ncbi:hypothetical protein FF38_06722 [Lucilia cuprina]|uniref:Uncharacterized protein n=1 Tax=Lucilia cuprina TaxID=7375 RepID=A0A0L0C4X3_LUCCU|nr:hypothetical protein FF38_06722 [Lucilia cuprina]